MAFLLPKGVVSDAHASKTRMNLQFPDGAVSALAALSLMWIAQGALWAFASTAGTESGMDADSLVKWFSIAGFTTPFGALAATTLGGRRGYGAPFIIGFGAQIFVALAEYCFFSAASFYRGRAHFQYDDHVHHAVCARCSRVARRDRTSECIQRRCRQFRGRNWPCAWCRPHRPNGSAHRHYVVRHVLRRPRSRPVVFAQRSATFYLETRRMKSAPTD